MRADLLVGLNGAVRQGRFAPLLVTLQNDGPALEVRIEVRVAMAGAAGGRGPWRTLARTVSLPRDGSRRYSFTLPVPFNPGRLAVVVTEAGRGRGAGEVVRQEVDLRGLVAGDRLFAVVSSELSFDPLSGLAAEGEQARVVYPHPQNLPDSWAAWDIADLVVVRDTSGLRLRQSQVTALAQWVFAGGTLVFTGGAPALMLAASGLGALVPVEGESPGGGVGLQSPGAGSPPILSRRLGSGRIWFFPFDPAASRPGSWEETRALWKMAAGRPRPAILRDQAVSLAEDPWMEPLLAAPELSLPSPLAVLAFAGCYLAALVLLAVPRLGGRLRAGLRAVLVIAASLAAAAAGFLLFNRIVFDSRSLLADASRVDCVAGDGLAVVTERAGLLSAAGPSFGVKAGGRPVLTSATPAGVLVEEDAGQAAGKAVSVTGAAGRRFAGALLELSSVIDFPLDAALSGRADGFVLQISNMTRLPLDGAFLSTGGKLYPVGSVPAGSVAERTLAESQAVKLPATGVPLPAGIGAAAVDPAVGGLWAQAFTAEDREKTLLVAMARQSPLGLRRTGNSPPARLEPVTLVVLEIR